MTKSKPSPKPKVSFPIQPAITRSGAITLAVLVVPTLLVIVLLVATNIPLGIVGEWVWNRAASPPWNPLHWLLPLAALAIYLVVAVLGAKWLSKLHEAWIVLLGPLAILFAALWQWALVEFPNPGGGPERWIPSQYFKATSGYFTVAQSIDDTRTFLEKYESWAKKADSFHLGTHPPGLILLHRFSIDSFERNPELGHQIEQWVPGRVRDGFEIVGAPLPQAERSALLAISIGTWFVSLLTMIPIYGLVRLGGTKIEAWWGALFWPAIPASTLFLPVGDALYPFLAASILWLTIASFQARIGILALMAGGLLWIGMMLSLAFVVVAAIGGVTVVWLAVSEGKWGRGIITLLALAAGLLLPVELLYDSLGLNLIEVWRINLTKHAGFYDAMPRSYVPWIFVDLIEFAIVSGPGLFLAATITIVTRAWWKNAPAVDQLLAVWLVLLIFLDLSGRNRSEVARLWLFLAPLVVIGAARGLGRFQETRFPWLLPASGLAISALLSLVAIGWTEPLLPVVALPGPSGG